MKPGTLSFYEHAVRNAIRAVTCNLDQALDVHALARCAALSPFHFHRVFRGMVGETPIELHRRLRLERAAWFLRHQETPVTEIAFAAGYETHESFTRAFRLRYDCSPSEFRQGRAADGPGCAQPYPIELTSQLGIHFRPEGVLPFDEPLIRGDIDMNVLIKEMPELRVATLRHTGPYNRISEAFARLGQVAGQAGLFGPESMMLGLYYDDPETTPPAELHSDAALVVSAKATIPSGLVEQKVAQGRYACYSHMGSYDKLGDAWSRLMGDWLPKSGQRMRDGVSFEIYRNMPGQVPEEQLQTEIYIPLE